MSDPFLGEIVMFAGNFAPRGWAFCDGTLLPISQNSALFSLLGTMYGGDGRTTFGLPDLRGRGPVGVGNGPGLSNIVQGQKGGAETVTLLTQNLPPHSHTVNAVSSDGQTGEPGDQLLAKTTEDIYHAGAADTNMGSSMINNTGNGQAFGIRSPFQSVQFIIAIQGTFPSRN